MRVVAQIDVKSVEREEISNGKQASTGMRREKKRFEMSFSLDDVGIDLGN
jgi:hypothetical protein